MPFKSKAQQGFMFAHPEILGKEGLKEWSEKTNFSKLPQHIKHYLFGGIVDKTGPAVLHEGEKVVPNIFDRIKSVYQDWKGKVDTGNRESEGLGNELRGRAESTGLVKAPEKPILAPAISPKDKVGAGPYGSRPGEKRIDTKEMTKPLGSLDKGTDYVPKTGVYLVHKGEKVVPKKENMATNPYAKITEGDKEAAKPPKHIKEIKTRKSHDGKFIHTHVHHHPEHHPDEEHVSNDVAEMTKHLADHGNAPTEGGPEGGPAPMAAAAPPLPQQPTIPGLT